MSSERAAIAREVLLAALQYMRDEGFASKERDAMVRYIERVAPPPPAQETVTVTVTYVGGSATYERHAEHGWLMTYTGLLPNNDAKLDRIAADARRIAELEESERTLKGHLNQVYEELRPVSDGEYLAAELATLAVARIAELENDVAVMRDQRDEARREVVARDARIAELHRQIGVIAGDCVAAQHAGRKVLGDLEVAERERDEARRALEAMRLTPAQSGDGLGHAAKPNSEVSDAAVGPSPAPIPLGATVVVEGDLDSPYERVAGGWIRESTPRWQRVQRLHKIYTDDDSSWGMVLTALYRALHPVATRETVERVERALRGVRGGLGSSHDWMYAQAARAALTAAGITIQEGA